MYVVSILLTKCWVIKQPIGGKELETNHREYNVLQKIDGKQGYHTRKIDDKQVFQKKIKVNNKCTTYCTIQGHVRKQSTTDGK